MTSRSLFEEHLEAIERAIARVCRDARLDSAAQEDFGSSARIALLADDCAILRKFEGRSSMATYLTIVVRRLFVDARRAEGRWYTSAEAQRRGPAAVRLEQLIVRERRGLSDAAEIVRREHPELTLREIEALAAVLPERTPRPQFLAVGDGDTERFASPGTSSDLADALDAARQSRQASEAVQRAMAAMTPEDRVILRLRFTGDASIASIARSLGIEQRPLYRRIEALLGQLRKALEAAGVDAASAAGLIGAPGEMLNFGLERKNGEIHPSSVEEGS